MKRIKNEVHPKSFVSNFWGAPQNILHSIILAASTLLKESNKNPLDIMKRKTSTRICIILSLVCAALLMPASCGYGGERVFLVYGQYDSRHIYVNDVNAAAIKFIDYKGVSSNLF